MRRVANVTGLFITASLTSAGNVAHAQLSADETRAIVSEMLADSESRSSLLSGAGAGYDGRGFSIQGDGFNLTIGGQLQFRYVADIRDDANPDDFDTGFQARRTKLNFTGTVADDWNFRIEFNFDDDGGGAMLEDAYVTYGFGDGWALGLGQVRAPLSREFQVDSKHQLAVERSLVDTFFSGGRSQAVWVGHQGEDHTFAFAFSDGANAANSDFSSAAESDWSISTRFQYKFMGEWSQFDDFTSPRGSETALMAGAAFHAQGGPTVGKGSQTGAGSDVDLTIVRYFFDVSAEGDGWNGFAAFSGQYLESNSLAGDADFNDFGVVVQGGYYVAENTELFGRWEGLFLDDDRGISDDSFNFLTFGVNQYYAGHAAKATVDAVVGLDETDSLVTVGLLPNTGSGQLGDVDTGEITLRLQFQLLF